MMSRNDKNKKKTLVALTGAAAITLLVASIAVIGAAQPSYQQQQQQLTIRRGFITSWMIQDNSITSEDLREGAAVRSSDIVDGQVNTADLADNAVTSDKIRDGEVKAEDLDPSIELGGGSNSFSLQVTERSSTTVFPEGGSVASATVQCNSDEVVTGGGFTTPIFFGSVIKESKKHDNGWSATWANGGHQEELTVYAECLKIVPAAAE